MQKYVILFVICMVKYVPSGRTTALGSTQPLTELSTRNLSWEADNLTTSCADCLEILGASTYWISESPSRPVMG
jgi:hypothetical protein